MPCHAWHKQAPSSSWPHIAPCRVPQTSAQLRAGARPSAMSLCTALKLNLHRMQKNRQMLPSQLPAGCNEERPIGDPMGKAPSPTLSHDGQYFRRFFKSAQKFRIGSVGLRGLVHRVSIRRSWAGRRAFGRPLRSRCSTDPCLKLGILNQKMPHPSC